MRLKMAHVANQIHDLLEMLMLWDCRASFWLTMLVTLLSFVTVLVMGIPNQSHVLLFGAVAFFQVSRAAFRVSVFVTTFAGSNHECCRGQLKQIFVFMVCLRIQDNSRSVV